MSLQYVAFFSYTRADDELDSGLLTAVRGKLEKELQATLARRDIEIFQDRDDIEPGDPWKARLQKAIDEAVFLIPVITPLFFKSDFCREEFSRFWDKADADPQAARIIPIYWRNCYEVEKTAPDHGDPLVDAVKAIHYDDWRELRFSAIDAPAMRRKIHDMADLLGARYRGIDPVSQPKPIAKSPGIQPPSPSAPQGRIGINARACYGSSAEAKAGWFKPGNGKEEWFQDHPLGPEMVVIPAGEYLMGGPPGEEGRDDDEGPQHLVTIGKPFAVGRFAITFGEFTTFVEATGHEMPDKIRSYEEGKWKEREGRSFRNPGFAQTAKHPVVGVSWDDATAYCQWLSQQTSHDYRLLSEAGWEYVCRAGTITPFWWGDKISTGQANYDGNYTYGGGSKGEFRKGTVSVQNFDANPWGLYQVHGNVWEWCADAWHENHRGAPDDGSVRKDGDSSRRVVRGGSWSDGPRGLRSANRFGFQPVSRYGGLGFRVSRTLNLES